MDEHYLMNPINTTKMRIQTSRFFSFCRYRLFLLFVTCILFNSGLTAQDNCPSGTPEFYLIAPEGFCPGDAIELAVEGPPDVTYSWTGAAALGIPDGTGAGPITGLAADNTSGDAITALLSITGTDAGGCSHTLRVELALFSRPAGEDVVVEVCEGALFSIDLQKRIASGGAAGFQYELVAGAGLSHDGNLTGLTDSLLTGAFDNDADEVRQAVYSVTPIATDGDCAGAPFTVVIDVLPNPSGMLVADTLCSGAPAGIMLEATGSTTAAVAFDVEFLSITGNLIGTPTTGAALPADAIEGDSFRNRTSGVGSVVYQVTPISAAGCRGRVFQVRLSVLPEPRISAALQVAGVDFPASGVCGHFNVIGRLLIENTGKAPLTDLGARLDLRAPEQYGAAFQRIAPNGAPRIVESTAAADPQVRANYDGNGNLFVAGAGRLEPGQQLLLQFTFEINPEAAGAPAALSAQGIVRAQGDFSALGEAFAAASCPATDLSDSGDDAQNANPGAPGDTGSFDDPTPLGDCWQLTRQVALNDQVLVTADANCELSLTADMLVENHFPRCDQSVLPLGGYYRIYYQGEELKGPLDVSDNIDAVMAFEVRTVNNPCEPVLTFVRPEDKTPPIVTCPDDVVGLIRSGASAAIDYRPTSDPQAAAADEVFHYLACTDVDSVYRDDRSWKNPRYPYFTGVPEVVEACGIARIIDVQESLEVVDCSDQQAAGERQPANRLLRRFFYSDNTGNIDSCEQVIYFFRPFLYLPDCEVTLDQCLYDGGADISPAAIQSAPYFRNGLGETIFPGEEICGLTLGYEDQALAGPEACGFKIIRTWTLLDGCYAPEGYAPGIEREAAGGDCPGALFWENKTLHYEQHLIIGDDTPPRVTCPPGEGQDAVMVFSTRQLSCAATVAPPPPLVGGECRTWKWEFDLYGYRYDPRRLRYDYVLVGTSTGGVLDGVETGEYELIYRVTDACGNEAESDPCAVIVGDDIAPVAKCDDQLNVSVGGGGVARVTVGDVDEGSWDNCGPVDLHTRRSIETDCLDPYVMALAGGKAFADLEEVASQVPGRFDYFDGEVLLLTLENGIYWSRWDTLLYFTCCDVSVDQEDRVRVELRATDRGGTSNVCWMDILVEDKAGPACDVRDASVPCTGLDFDPNDPAQVAERFGSPEEVVLVLDNCGASITETLRFAAGDCGTGVLERFFTVTDASGIAASCTQRIDIEEVNAYALQFPGDLVSNECGSEETTDMSYESFACDLLAVDRDTARFSASGEECFQQLLTYTVINWCEYDGESEMPTVIPRDLDRDGKLEEPTWLEAAYDRDFAETYLPGESNFFIVKLFTAGDDGHREALPGQVLVRADCPDSERHYGYRAYRLNAAGGYELDCSTGIDCSEGGLAGQCWTPGFYEYTQVVQIFDAEAPFIEVRNDDLEFCAFGNPGEDCGGQVHIVFDVLDDCTPDDVEVRNLRLLPNGDPAQVLTLDDGVFTLSNEDSRYILSGKLPLGRHRFQLQAFDGCGNLAGLTIDFSVVDCKAPAPICINGITVELMPVDTDDDGMPDMGMNTIRAADYIASPLDDCAGPIAYSINWSGEPADREKSSLEVTCDYPLYETLPVEVHAWDSEGNHDFCETFVIIQDFQGLCDKQTGGAIAGLIRTEEDEAIEGVRVQLSGKESRMQRTAADGLYRFTGLSEGYDYSVHATLDDENPTNGVSTLDLIQISKHILGVKRFESPYTLIAADINNSGTISTLDLIQLRKLILGVNEDFQNNNSWRFVPGALTFADPQAPWPQLPPGGDIININNLSGALDDTDFIGIKIGDVNGNARANQLQEAEVRNTAGSFILRTAARPLRRGETLSVDLRGEAMDRIQGAQFTLSYDRRRLELEAVHYGLAKVGQLAVFTEEGMVTVSWNTPVDRRLDLVEGTLFRLAFRAVDDGRLSEALQVDSRRTPAEAYDLDDEPLEVLLRFEEATPASAGFALYQNQPNPFRDETLIGFELPEAGEAILRVHDLNGRLLQQQHGVFDKGYHEVRLDQGQLPSGVLYYTLETGTHTATRKMVRIE